LLASYPLGGPVSSIAFGNLGASADAAVAAGGDLFIILGPILGPASSSSSSSMQLERVGLPMAATTVALGSFVYDREGRTQIALMGPDGAVHIIVRSGMIHALWRPRSAGGFSWPPPAAAQPGGPSAGPERRLKVLESFGLAGPGPLPVMFRTRISSNAADDLMVLDGFYRPDGGHLPSQFAARSEHLRAGTGIPPVLMQDHRSRRSPCA